MTEPLASPTLALLYLAQGHRSRAQDVARAIRARLPIVALESTVLTHGLPRPQKHQLARDMELAVREEGATPATVGFLDGQLHIGLDDLELERLANEKSPYKVSPRDFATVITNMTNGGTTVSGTMFACKKAPIKVFATGGIGGVQRENRFDISADLHALASIPMLVICAGAKAVLDLPATLEYLETMSVPVIGYGVDDFPAFYSRESGLGVSEKLDTPQDVVAFAKAHWDSELPSAVLVANPVPKADAIWPRAASRRHRRNIPHAKSPLPSREATSLQEGQLLPLPHTHRLTGILILRDGAVLVGIPKGAVLFCHCRVLVDALAFGQGEFAVLVRVRLRQNLLEGISRKLIGWTSRMNIRCAASDDNTCKRKNTDRFQVTSFSKVESQRSAACGTSGGLLVRH